MRLAPHQATGDGNERLDSPLIMGLAIAPIVALIAGILILFMPRLLNYIVALYLIVIGILGLAPRLLPGLAA